MTIYSFYKHFVLKYHNSIERTFCKNQYLVQVTRFDMSLWISRNMKGKCKWSFKSKLLLARWSNISPFFSVIFFADAWSPENKQNWVVEADKKCNIRHGGIRIHYQDQLYLNDLNMIKSLRHNWKHMHLSVQSRFIYQWVNLICFYSKKIILLSLFS